MFYLVARALHKERLQPTILMNPNQTNNAIHESTYALLVRSEEKERSLFEIIAYGLVILSAVAAIWQFAHQPLNLPLDSMPRTASVERTQPVAQS
jgi:hypothetical protein